MMGKIKKMPFKSETTLFYSFEAEGNNYLFVQSRPCVQRKVDCTKVTYISKVQQTLPTDWSILTKDKQNSVDSVKSAKIK